METLLVIAGPTAAGKSAVALAVAAKSSGEIINADSVQVYRGLDIGTAKPTRQERESVPHHMLDIADPRDNYTVARYRQETAGIIKEIHNRGKLPILVGGTGLYIRAVVMGYAFSESGVDEGFRAQLQAIAEREGPDVLHRQLAEIDPQTAQKLHPNDLRRVIRALEVYRHSHVPISCQVALTAQSHVYNTVMVGITMSRDRLYRKIEDRVDRMMDMGLVDEVRGLLNGGIPPQAKSMQSLGYRQIVGYLQNEYSLGKAVELIKRDTRRFAKRQLTWFRRENEMIWFNREDYANDNLLAENISNNLAGYYHLNENK
jgi:tRNA dimethylallyltransferase